MARLYFLVVVIAMLVSFVLSAETNDKNTVISVPPGSKIVITGDKPAETSGETTKQQPPSSDEEARSRNYVGLWYNNFDGIKNGVGYNTPGLASLMFGKGSVWNFDPMYIEFRYEFYTPQILWKSVGVGLYYFFCYTFTGGEKAGKCGRPSFGTGERDSGSLNVSSLFGVKIPGTPLRVQAGPDLGFYYSGSTPRPFTSIMARGGVAWDIAKSFGLETGISHSIWMREWSIDGVPMRVKDPSLTYYGLNMFLKW